MTDLTPQAMSCNDFVRGREPVVSIKVRREDGSELAVKGREAFALHALIELGTNGVTPIEYPGPRWSDYVFKLRKHGLVVETIDEKHGGAFAGSHARYVLRTPVTVVAIERQSRQRGAA